MSKKIIVAGAGHGGIAAASILAKNGFDVTVYERYSEGNLGYDWTDIFHPAPLQTAGMDLPSADKYEYKNNMTFFSPNQKTPLTQSIPKEELEIKMERKDIYAHLISHALQCGVKFVYDCNITAPILIGNRVVGIKTDKGDFYADMIIDAAGLNTPIRVNLPDFCMIENNVRLYEKLFVYRAFYDNPSEKNADFKYKVYLLPDGEQGIAWVASEGEYTDLLIGRFKPFGQKEIDSTLDFLCRSNPWLGREIQRGGQFTQIPVRQPLSVMVCDGYAAIGDSAFMTIPIIGSGISNSLKAAKMLADTVIADKDGIYNAHTLWQYQVAYYKNLGAGLGQLACIKSLLLTITPNELDFCFEKGILTAQDLMLGSCNTSVLKILKLTPKQVAERGGVLLENKDLLKRIAGVAAKVGETMILMSTMPKTYSYKAVRNWAERYGKFYSGKIN